MTVKIIHSAGPLTLTLSLLVSMAFVSTPCPATSCPVTAAELFGFAHRAALTTTADKRKLYAFLRKAKQRGAAPGKQARRAQRLHEALREHLTRNGVQTTDVFNDDGKPMLLIHPSEGTRVGQLALFIKHRFGRVLYSDVHYLLENDTYAYADDVDCGVGQCMAIRSLIELDVFGPEGHEVIHLDNGHKLNTGVDSLYHGSVLQGESEVRPEHETRGYDDVLPFEELLAYSYSISSAFDEGRQTNMTVTVAGFQSVDRLSRLLKRLSKRAGAATGAALKTLDDEGSAYFKQLASRQGHEYLEIMIKQPRGDSLEMFDVNPDHVQSWRSFTQVANRFHASQARLIRFEFDQGRLQAELGAASARTVTKSAEWNRQTEGYGDIPEIRLSLDGDQTLRLTYGQGTPDEKSFIVAKSKRSLEVIQAIGNYQNAHNNVQPLYTFIESRLREQLQKWGRIQQLAAMISQSAKARDFRATQAAIEALTQETFGSDFPVSDQ